MAPNSTKMPEVEIVAWAATRHPVRGQPMRAPGKPVVVLAQAATKVAARESAVRAEACLAVVAAVVSLAVVAKAAAAASLVARAADRSAAAELAALRSLRLKAHCPGRCSPSRHPSRTLSQRGWRTFRTRQRGPLRAW